MRLGGWSQEAGDMIFYPGSGPLDGGKTLRPTRFILDDMSITRVDLPRGQRG